MKLKTWFKSIPVSYKAATIGGICAIIAALIVILPSIIRQFTSEAALELVDISVVDTHGFPSLLDVKIRNTGSKTAFIKKAEFYVDKVFLLKRIELFEYIPISRTYRVELQSNRKTPYVTAISLSQSIKPEDVDRFQFALGCKNYSSKIILLFEVYVKFIYNKSNNIVKSKSIIFLMQPPYKPRAYFIIDEATIKKNFEHNIALLEEITNSKAIKSEGVNHFINEIPYMKKYLKQK